MTSARETLDSMTGFEELAIEKATGKGLELWYTAGRDLVVTRIAATVLECRSADDGKTPLDRRMKAAYEKIQGLPQTAVSEYFSDPDDEDPFPDEPVTDVGKDSSLPDDEPESSLSSASSPE